MEYIKPKAESSTDKDVALKPQPEQLADSVAHYLAESSENGVLRPHQRDVFEDLESFLRAGEHRGYIDLPTGTGKTVLFVELAKALLDVADGAPVPRILVVTPTMDLVNQTLGRSGEKGFGGFASELTVTPYFGGSKREDRERFTSSDVGITTYVSFDILHNQRDFVPAREMGASAVQAVFNMKYDGYLSRIDYDKRGDESWDQNEKRVRLREKLAYANAQRYINEKYTGEFKGEPMINAFDVVFLDEAHHALPGSAASGLVKSLPESTFIIGFTATPDANEVRRLKAILPREIHSMSLTEAIDADLLSPVTSVALRSGLKITGSDIYSPSGDYLDEKISYLSESKRRNDIVLEAATTFADRGIGTVISCIAGGEALHARRLAEELTERGVKATAVHSGIKVADRAKIYERFERGDIDVLTFIGVLGEGWDSNRAKAIINARPTRSQIFAKQRIGRVARPGGLAYTVDIFDEYDDGNPPIMAADLLTEEGIPYGTTVGTVDDEERAGIDAVLDRLKKTNDVVETVESTYVLLQRAIKDLPRLERGQASIKGKTYCTPGNVNTSFGGVSAEIIMRAAELQGVSVDSGSAVKSNLIREVFERNAAQKVLHDLPVVSLNKYYVDSERQRWASFDGWALLFAKRFPGVRAGDIDTALTGALDQPEWLPVKTVDRPSRDYSVSRAHKFYRVTDESVAVINAALTDMYTSID